MHTADLHRDWRGLRAGVQARSDGCPPRLGLSGASTHPAWGTSAFSVERLALLRAPDLGAGRLGAW